jgi:tRNA dimethylallyltransferase
LETGKIKIVIIMGPTASGKTRLALELAGIFDGEIVSADSMQVYRHMDIGTAKPTKEERREVPHHVIDVVDPDEDYSAARYMHEAREAIKEIDSRGKKIFVVGGTGLYIRALTKGLFKGPAGVPELRQRFLREAELKGKVSLYEELREVDPVAASTIHPNNIPRIIRALEVYHVTDRPISEFQKAHAFKEEEFGYLKIGLRKTREELYRDIEERVDRMVKEGLVREARGLVCMGYSPDLKPMQGLGYKEMVRHISGRCTLEEAVSQIKTNTRRYAKRQMTWFNREGDISWFSPGEKGEIVSGVKAHLDGSPISKGVIS